MVWSICFLLWIAYASADFNNYLAFSSISLLFKSNKVWLIKTYSNVLVFGALNWPFSHWWQCMAFPDKSKMHQLPQNHVQNGLHHSQPNLEESFLSGIKQRLLSFIFRRIWNEEKDRTLVGYIIFVPYLFIFFQFPEYKYCFSYLWATLAVLISLSLSLSIFLHFTKHCEIIIALSLMNL